GPTGGVIRPPSSRCAPPPANAATGSAPPGASAPTAGAGRRARAGKSANPAHRPEGAGGPRASGRAGRTVGTWACILTMRAPPSATGASFSDGALVYGWDGHDRLATAGPASAPNRSTWTYDGLSRRAQVTDNGV